jgi:hypothetical protein
MKTVTKSGWIKNLPGAYLSLARTAPAQATHTVPLEIRYEPSDAKITEVHIGLSSGGGDPEFVEGNLLGQNHSSSPGVIKFPSLVLPVIPGEKVSDKVNVTVRLKGSVKGTDAVSDPAEGGSVSFVDETAFVPLYLANDEAALAARRYGFRDNGGDSWATQQTIGWLSERAYRFDDISGQHVTQNAQGRSILVPRLRRSPITVPTSPTWEGSRPGSKPIAPCSRRKRLCPQLGKS